MKSKLIEILSTERNQVYNLSNTYMDRYYKPMYRVEIC